MGSKTGRRLPHLHSVTAKPSRRGIVSEPGPRQEVSDLTDGDFSFTCEYCERAEAKLPRLAGVAGFGRRAGPAVFLCSRPIWVLSALPFSLADWLAVPGLRGIARRSLSLAWAIHGGFSFECVVCFL